MGHPKPGGSFCFKHHRLPCEIILNAVRWCLRYLLSYQDVADLLDERGITVDRSILILVLMLAKHIKLPLVQAQRIYALSRLADLHSNCSGIERNKGVRSSRI